MSRVWNLFFPKLIDFQNQPESTLSGSMTLTSARDGNADPILSKEESNDLRDVTFVYFGSLSLNGRVEKSNIT